MDKVARGFSTLEVLIAMVIGVMTIGAVIIASFGTQSMILATEMNADAVRTANALAETTLGLNKSDFNLVNPVATSTDGAFQKSVTVTLLSDYLTKLVTSFVAWKGDHGQDLYTRVDSLVTNLENVHAPNTCGSVLSGDWTNPQISAPIDVDTGANNASGNPVQAVDVHAKRLYVVTDNAHGNNENFYIFDISADPLNPTYVSSLKTVTASAGLNAVVVASTTSAKYAYVGSAYDANFRTCTPGPNCSQLQVINVINPNAPAVVTNYLIPTSTAPFVLGNMTGSGQAVVKSIFYHDGIIYLGLSKTASGPEFVVVDVGGGGIGGTPLSPRYLGSYSVGAGVSDISVKGRYAYLATADNTRELIVLDVSTPASPSLAGVYNAPGTTNFGYGKSVYLVGQTLYFARTYVSNAPEFYFLNTSNISAPSVSASKDIGTAADTQSVNGVLVRDYLAFLTTRDYFQVWNIATPSSMSLVKQFDLTALVGPGSGGLATDCEGNYLYVGSYRSNNDKGVILVVYPGVPLDYTLSHSGNVTVAPGGSGNTTITRTFVSGTAQPVTLSITGLPAGASASFLNNPCTGTCSSILTITTTGATPQGSYIINVFGSPNGTSNPVTTFTLTVATSFDYTVSALAIPSSIPRNAQSTVTVTVVKTAGSAQPVAVTMSGFPNNVTYAPSSQSCIPNTTCTVVFTVSAPNNAQKTTKTVTVTGTPPTKTTTFSFTVQ